MFHPAQSDLLHPRAFSNELLEDAIAFFLQNHPGYAYGRANMDKHAYEGPLYPGDHVQGGPLWDEFLRLHEAYYVKRQQDWLVQNRLSWLKNIVGPVDTIVDFGCGGEESARNVAVPFLKHFNEASQYVPIDLSKSFLKQATAQVKSQFSSIEILPYEADYVEAHPVLSSRKKLGIFFGASMNFASFPSGLNHVFNACKQVLDGGHLVVCLDLNTNAKSIRESYEHPVHSEQEVNLLYRLKRDLPIEGDLDPESWRYDIDINPIKPNDDVVMVNHVLIPSRDQIFSIADTPIRVQAEERLEHAKSYKVSLPYFDIIAQRHAIFRKGVTFDPEHRLAMAVYDL